MNALDPMNIPLAPMPAWEDPQVEADFAQLPLNHILDQLLGYSQLNFCAVNYIPIPDVYTDARPEALHDALCALVAQLQQLQPPQQDALGELLCQRCYDYLDSLHRSMAPHAFKLGYLFGRAQPPVRDPRPCPTWAGCVK